MLDEEDRRNLRRFERRLQLVRDRTRGVAEGWQTGFYLWGAGGIGKSWTVVDELDRLDADYKLTNSRLTAKGLFKLLEESPDVVHVLEDMESLCRSQDSAGVLRSALWTTKPDRSRQHQERLLTWVTGVEKREFVFTGGLILIMNLPLDDLPELRAVKTRIAHLHLQPSPPEVRALMKSIASEGYEHGGSTLTPEECIEVFDFVVGKINEAGRVLDLRLMVNGFADRLQWEAGHSENHWRDMVESRMRERVIEPATREVRIGNEREIALEIDSLAVGGAEKLRLWEARTGKGKSAYYRRLQGE